MDERVQINFRCSSNLVERLDKHCPEGKKSEFISDAIEEKLDGKEKDNSKTLSLVRQVEKLDPTSLLKKLVDLELLNQYLFEEIKKQNELMKLIHRRSIFAATFSNEVYKEGKDKAEVSEMQQKLVNQVETEVKNLKI